MSQLNSLSPVRRLLGVLAFAVVILLPWVLHPAGARADALFGSSVHREPASEPWPAAIARYDAMFGPRVLRIYFPGAPKPWTAPELSQGRPVVVSFKLSPREVLAGTDDAAMRTWFATAPRDHQVWWSYWAEPEDDIGRGTFTAADYRAAFAHLDALADRASNPMLSTTQVLMDWTLDRHSGRNWRTYYPGARVIDVQAWDQYHYAKPPTCAYQSMSAHDAKRPAYEISRAEGNGYAIAEIGSASCVAQRPAWLTAIGAWARTRAVFVTYFNSTVGGDYRLTDPASQRAWRNVVNGSTPPPQDTTPPAFLSGPSVASIGRHARRVRLRFELSEAGTVKVDVRRVVIGRLRGGRCVGSVPPRHGTPRCMRLVLFERVSRAAHKGRNAIAMRRRAGIYRATMVATDNSANAGPPAQVWFRVPV